MHFDRLNLCPIWAILLILIGAPCQADSADKSELLSYQLEVLREHTTHWTVAEAANSPNWTQLDRTQRRNVNFGFTDDTVWVRIKIATAHAASNVIVVEYPLLDDLILYGDAGTEFNEIARSGDSRHIADRAIIDRFPMFEVSADSPGTKTYYLRIRTGGSMQIPIAIVSSGRLNDRTARQNLLFGAYYGFMIVLAIVALVAVVHLRERLFAYYFAYLVSFILAMFSLNGYAYVMLWPSGGQWANIAPPLFSAFTCLFGVLFAANFLRAHTLGPSAIWGVRTLIASAVFAIGTSIAGLYPLCVKAAVCTGIGLVLVVLYTTINAYRRKVPGASYFMFAWGVFLGGVLIMDLVIWGIVPTNLLTANAMQISSMVDVVILAMALIERSKELRREKASAVERANRYLSAMNEKLEDQVSARTQELEAKNELLRNQAIRDSLTGLLNHKAVIERLKEELSAMARFDHPVAAVMMDIDHFKSVNDEHGHQTGDKVLQEIALTLRAHLRRYDVCGRYGGDEFIIILNRASREESIHFAERLRADIATLKIPDKPSFRVTASFGISVHLGPVHARSAEELVADADRALYEAKAGGRDIVRFYPTKRPTPVVVQ